MKRMMGWNVLLALVTILGGAISPAAAVVTGINATVTAEVREIIDGNVANTDFAFEELDETTGNLPLQVIARLVRSAGEPDTQDLASGAQAITTLHDPRLAIEPDPDELGVDLAVFSRTEGIAYDGSCQAVEIRDVTFTTDDVNALPGTALQAQSIFFLDGQLFLWAEDGGTDLSGTTADVEIQVVQTRSGQSPVVVMSATITLTGQADGSVNLDTSGVIQPQNLVLVDLTGSVPGLGATHMLVIPYSAIPYVYNAAVQEEFQLTAQVDAAVANRPGTGASVVLGLPLDELVGLMDEVIPGDVQEEIGNALNNAVMNAPDPQVPLTDDETGVRILCFCGLFGVESVMMLTLMATAMCVRHARRRRWTDS